MNRFLSIWIAALLLILALASLMPAQDKETLYLVQTISMPNAKGRNDRMDVDVTGKRLFVAGQSRSGNDSNQECLER
jgi:hypothetical protein